MKKDFKFCFFAVTAALILTFFMIPARYFPRQPLFKEDNPLNSNVESEVSLDAIK